MLHASCVMLHAPCAMHRVPCANICRAPCAGLPGGLKERAAVDQWDREPTKILRDAVKGMLPKNKTQVRMLGTLWLTAHCGSLHTLWLTAHCGSLHTVAHCTHCGSLHTVAHCTLWLAAHIVAHCTLWLTAHCGSLHTVAHCTHCGSLHTVAHCTLWLTAHCGSLCIVSRQHRQQRSGRSSADVPPSAMLPFINNAGVGRRHPGRMHVQCAVPPGARGELQRRQMRMLGGQRRRGGCGRCPHFPVACVGARAFWCGVMCVDGWTPRGASRLRPSPP
eukprot:363818-Chlamydomonas_euryale.AAC.6